MPIQENPALDKALNGLEPEHRRALEWFVSHAGEFVSWPGTVDGLLLATRARGIYKPAGSKFALSVRENVDSPYMDRPPRYGADGGWRYLYHQQGADLSSPLKQWDDKSLHHCMEAGVPVGVLRQVDAEPRPQYEVLGVARVVDWFDGYFVLDGYADRRGVTTSVIDFSDEGGWPLPPESRDPLDAADWVRRDQVARIIAQRRGQKQFRTSLLAAYGRRCAVTTCSAAPALEAAHIATSAGADINSVSNGLLLRADIHTLFDLGFLAVHDRDHSVLVSPELDGTEYVELAAVRLRLPSRTVDHPSESALRRHRVWAGL